MCPEFAYKHLIPPDFTHLNLLLNKSGQYEAETSKDSKLNREFEFKNEKSEYKSERTILVRNLDPEKIMNFAASFTEIETEEITRENRRQSMER